MVVDEKLENYLMSKRSGDWFITKHQPSYHECTEFRKMVFDNLLRMASPHLL